MGNSKCIDIVLLHKQLYKQMSVLVKCLTFIKITFI